MRRPRLFGGSSSGAAAAAAKKASGKLGVTSGVYIPVCLNIISILMFLRFGVIVGQIGLAGILGLLVIAYSIDLLTTLSLSAIASNGEVKGGGAYYLISRSLGPEFGGSIGLLFFLSQVLNTSLNVVGLLDCIRLNIGDTFPQGYWVNYGLQTIALVFCTALCLAGSAIFAKASNALLLILTIAIISIPVSSFFKTPFVDAELGVEFTGISWSTLSTNLFPNTNNDQYKGLDTFRDLFGILFPATSGIFAGASMSGDLRNPSKSIPRGTLWAMFSTFICYLVVITAMASSITHDSLLGNPNVIPLTNLSAEVIMAGECAVTLFSALMGVIAAAKLLQALARDKLLPGMSVFGKGTKKGDEPILAILLTYALAQLALLADLNQIATLISMGYQMTFFVMNLACFLLKIGSAPNFRPAFKFFNWQTAAAGAFASAFAMFFINETYASAAVLMLVFLFTLIHYLCPPKRWGDVSQNLIYHQVRKYLLRLRPEHIKFWRPQIILLVNNPRTQARLIQFCNSLKKGSLYILGHVIVSDDFNVGVHEARLQQNAWTSYIAEYQRLKAFVQLTMSPSITWGVRNLILAAGLGGMRPNIAVLGFYNMDELYKNKKVAGDSHDESTTSALPEQKAPRRRRADTSSKMMDGILPTDLMRIEGSMKVTEYMTILEDLALRYKLNVAVGTGFENLETPDKRGNNSKKYIDLWPIQMSAEVTADGRSIQTTNFDTYTLILQLGFILRSVPTWKSAYKLRVLVFVEYENEVEQERIRVKALLDKLRIDAEFHVFWLADGNLRTYNLLVNGESNDVETENMVHSALRDEEWWHELKMYRSASSMSASQEAVAKDTISGRRSSFFNYAAGDLEAARNRLRRHSVADLLSNPTVSKLSRLGVTVGIHTSRLGTDVFDDSDIDVMSSDDESHAEMEIGDMEYFSSADEAEFDDEDRPDVRQPLLDGASKPASRSGSQSGTSTPRSRRKNARRSRSGGTGDSTPVSYGSLSTSTTLVPPPKRLTLPRQQSSVRFSSKPMPETLTNVDGESTGPTIMFAESPAKIPGAAVATPAVSRLSSAIDKQHGEEANGSQSTSRITFGESTYIEPVTEHTEAASRSPSPTGSSNPAYSAQHMSLSFNDLPSRAQHLVLNELIKRHSGERAAVVMSTLPVPVEGTSSDEKATVAYLEDVDVLCRELPPTLLVLSNNMTVTVGL
ncbi:hypothetical protein TD95_002159 [Thielaviopsis punctulata]|uniref:Amino acid permease/ SLC12A domain-containing protein n=1 Tax=Thielaviopsis punctulata TaxID=72032 RepID=A0A0F4Z6J9_9PEZI|nr:hypothetical protein TD95_002159 [Thielaviopsis punctulata]